MRRSLLLKPLLGFVTVAALLCLVEITCRLTGFSDPLKAPDPFVGFAGNHPLFQQIQDIVPRWEVPLEKINQGFHYNSMSAVKPLSVKRIFALGGSTVWGDGAGGRAGAFPNCLNSMLTNAYPSIPFEMLNCGVKGYASYRIRRLVEEIITYDPDLILLYTGHNELLEKRFQETEHRVTPLVDALKIRLHRSHAYTLLWSGFMRIRQTDTHRQMLDDALQRADDPIQFDRETIRELAPVSDQEWDQINARFRWNYRKILQLCRENHVPVLVMLPAYRLWMPPQVATHSRRLSSQEEILFDQQLNLAENALRTGDNMTLERAVFQLMKIDPDHAMARYIHALLLWNTGQPDAARTELLDAKDLDRRGHRQPEIIRKTMNAINVEYAVPALNVQSLLESAGSEDAPFGNEYFSDHVHINRRGHELLARRLFQIIIDQQLLELPHPHK